MPIESFAKAFVTPDTYECAFRPTSSESKLSDSGLENIIRKKVETVLECTLEDAKAEENPYGTVWKHKAFRKMKIGTVWIIKPHGKTLFTIKIFRDFDTAFATSDMIVFKFFNNL
ncbi:MAG TPA: hypothetical protein VK158_03145 [Acidobacteriota bacterium]|nr:hypothetical protein [Acidobacteriota bacterium]